MGDARTYKYPLIPEDVLLDKSGLSVLFEQSTTAPSLPAKSSTDTSGEDTSKRLGVDDVGDTNEVVEAKETLTLTELGIEVHNSA